MNVSSNQEDILLTQNGEPQKPININAFLFMTKFLSCFFGIPPNMFIAIVVIRLRRLHSKPRNIFLLGIIFSNLFTFVPAFMEMIYWVLPLEIVCQAYVAVVGLPNMILLWNMLLALVDRYVAIQYPIWHREKVTVRRVIYFLLFSSAFLIFLLKFVYIFGFAPLRCEIWFVHATIAGWTLIILFISCVIINFIVYRQTKTLLQKTRTSNPSKKESTQTLSNQNKKFSGEADHQENVAEEREIDGIELCELNATINESPNCKPVVIVSNLSSTMAIHVGSETRIRMELEAARTFIVGVASLFAMAFAIIIWFMIMHLCRLLTKFECVNLNWLVPYFKELPLFHSVYNPIIWLIRNDELWLVLKSKIDAISQKYASKY